MLQKMVFHLYLSVCSLVCLFFGVLQLPFTPLNIGSELDVETSSLASGISGHQDTSSQERDTNM